MPGTTSQLREAFFSARLFVLSSRFEGFPNVLLEAMAAGLPTGSFRCPSGPEDIVTHANDGWLVKNGDVAALSQSILEALNDRHANEMGRRATHVRETYSVQSVLAQWDAVLYAAMS